jgi:prephenate dehydrogenase
MNQIKSISIIGRGDFGQLVSGLIPKDIKHVNYGRQDTLENIESIGQSDVIILSVPLSAYADVLPALAPVIKAETLVVDVCSVKVKPAELLEKHLPGHHNVLLTHPLFGPQSFGNGRQHVLVVTNPVKDDKANKILEFCEQNLKLKVLHMSCAEHDKRMAQVHALTFFIARGLSQLELHAAPFMTPSFQELLDLVRLDASQTEALFQTIENGNPFAVSERQSFLDGLSAIHQDLAKHQEG